MILNPGTLNKKVDIYKPQKQTNDGWDTVKDTVLYKRISAAIYPVRGQEYYEAKKLRNDESVKIVIRYRKNIDDGCYIVYQNHKYSVQSVVDPNMTHESLELYCIEKKRGNADTWET